MAAIAWLMFCPFLFSLLSPLRPRGVGEKFSLGTLENYDIRIKSANDTGTEGQHQPRSCSHQNHYVTSVIPQHGDSTTVDLNVQTLYEICILTPERISQGHVQSGRRATFSWSTLYICRSQWPRGLRRRSAAARLLRLWVRIPPGHGYLSVVIV